MSTVANAPSPVHAQPPFRRPSPARSLRFLDRLGLLILSVNGVATTYKVDILYATVGASFALTKYVANGMSAGRYELHLMPPGLLSSCTCPGFRSHHHCKHISALVKLQELGCLPLITNGK